MKNIYTLLLTLAIVSVIPSCKKDNVAPKPAVADRELTLLDLRVSSDPTNVEFNSTGTLILREDYTWTTDLGGAKSHGTYSWTSTSAQQADIKFSITQWTDFGSNLALSDKLKLVLQSVDYCGFSLQGPLFCNFIDWDVANSWLRTNPK